MKLEQLERFLVVAEYLNFTTAAEKLYVGQSTISRQISNLEEELGVTLLIRGPRSVELTEAGKTLKREGKNVLKTIDQMIENVKTAGNGSTGNIRMISVPAIIPALDELHKYTLNKFPNLHLTYGQRKYEEIPVLLDRASCDVGVTYSFWISNNKAYKSMDLCEEYFCVLCSKKHWLAAYEDKGVYIDRLKDEEFYFGRPGLHLVTHPYDFTNDTVAHSAPTRFTSIEDMLMHLSVSSGIAILPSTVAKSFNYNLSCVPLLDEELKHHISMIWLADNDSPTLNTFLNVVKEFTENK
ncbi:MAG: LysR family transcriptional regulator [Eubacterium sp.]|nr:LysR family transcriptional regulator [Eubacterium sp.]